MSMHIKKTKNPKMFVIHYENNNIVSLLRGSQKITLEGKQKTVRQAYLSQYSHVPKGYL